MLRAFMGFLDDVVAYFLHSLSLGLNFLHKATSFPPTYFTLGSKLLVLSFS
jgi:hypothetical protein